MSQQKVAVMPAELNELRAASTASGGTALTTTATGAFTPLVLGMTPIPFGADYMSITPRNFAGCSVARIVLNPFLTIFYTTDIGMTITDISDEMQDGDATDHALDGLPAAGTGYMYVGARVPFRGVAVEIGTDANGTASELTVNYWNGTSWADASDTDNTESGGNTSFAVDGTVFWTVPGNWAAASLRSIGTALGTGAEYNFTAASPQLYTTMYWTRWEWVTALDSCDVVNMLALNRSTAYAEYLEGQTVELKVTPREVGNVQGITNAGTANLVINAGTLTGSEFE